MSTPLKVIESEFSEDDRLVFTLENGEKAEITPGFKFRYDGCEIKVKNIGIILENLQVTVIKHFCDFDDGMGFKMMLTYSLQNFIDIYEKREENS